MLGKGELLQMEAQRQLLEGSDVWTRSEWVFHEMIVRSLFQAQGRAYAKALTWNLFF